jgi:hypothetical protein
VGAQASAGTQIEWCGSRSCFWIPPGSAMMHQTRMNKGG